MSVANHGRPSGIPPRDSAYLEPGHTIGYNYEIIDRIGEGGMAVVYKARQKSLNRFVAVKALHPRFSSDESFIERFEAESGALASLSHANIVTIIDRGAEDKIFFFVMEYVDGEDLDKKIIGRRIPSSEWRSVIAACRDALDYIHKRGVVHRDIKPSNILVSSDGQVKIGDFGIAHIIAGDQAISESNTGPVGTAYYISPEQTNDPANVDARADIYSLAVAFYKMMTRSMPEGDFAPPSELNQEVPVAVDEVLFRAMAFDREERHRTVREFCDDLLRALSQQALSLSAVFKMGQGPSSLYSGEDFRAKPAGSDSKKTLSDSKKSTSDSRQFGKGYLASLPKGQAGPSPDTRSKKDRTPTPPPPKKDTTKIPVPVTVLTGTSEPPRHKTALVAVIAGVLVLLGVVLLAGGYYFIQKRGESRAATQTEGPVVPLTQTKSPAQIREEQAQELLRQRERELIGEPTPSPIPAEPEMSTER